MTYRVITLFICLFVSFVCGLSFGKAINFMIEQSAIRSRNKSSRIDILFLFCLMAYSFIMAGSGCGHLIEGLL